MLTYNSGRWPKSSITELYQLLSLYTVMLLREFETVRHSSGFIFYFTFNHLGGCVHSLYALVHLPGPIRELKEGGRSKKTDRILFSSTLRSHNPFISISEASP